MTKCIIMLYVPTVKYEEIISPNQIKIYARDNVVKKNKLGTKFP